MLQNEFKKCFITLVADKGSPSPTAWKHGKWFYMEDCKHIRFPNPYIECEEFSPKQLDLLGIDFGIGEQRVYEIWVREVDHSA